MKEEYLGRIVQFGCYRIGNAEDNSRIEWTVLDKKSENVLLLSKYVIEAMPFHEKYEETTWERCALRHWLNGPFYDSAFSASERASIVQVQNKNPDLCEVMERVTVQSPDNHGNFNKEIIPSAVESMDTLDKVFLLSVEEVEKYRHLLETIMVEPTPYALEKGVIVTRAHEVSSQGIVLQSGKDYCDKWWLRNRGEETQFACYATFDHSVSKTGFPVFFHKDVLYGVRPAIWVKASAL